MALISWVRRTCSVLSLSRAPARCKPPGCSVVVKAANEAASAFYQQALGLLPHTADLGGIVWTTLHVGDDAVAGVVKKQVASSPNRWNVYFATADIVETTRRAADLGATITAAGPGTSAG
jgi:predicted enzyme related to lactoylglutathione lyase